MAARTTSQVDFFPSIHGKRRRIERDIDVRDLQAAVKYGSKQKTVNGYKYCFAGITYITDETSTKEITSWFMDEPLDKAVLSSRDIYQIKEQKLRSKQSKLTSHTILIVDQSGSMNRSDVPNHRSRSRAVFFRLANHVIATPLLKNQVSYTDVVTLIIMKTTSEVVIGIDKEPITWELYNKFVDFAQSHPSNRRNQHGNYLPALDLAKIIMNASLCNCAMLLFFLSDGRPSDFKVDNACLSESEMKETIRQHLFEIGKNCGYRTTFGTYGFATQKKYDFSLLKEMTESAKQFGIQNSFFQNGLDSIALQENLTTLITTLTQARIKLSSIQPIKETLLSDSRRPELEKEQECEMTVNGDWDSWDFKTRSEHHVRRNKMVYNRYTELAKFENIKFLSSNASGFAIKKKFFGEGAERVVFDFQEIDDNRNLIGPPLCAKKNPKDEMSGRQLEFHINFALTQRQAKRLARKFNERLDFLKISQDIPRIEFLDCKFYVWMDNVNTRNQYTTGILAEEKLDEEVNEEDETFLVEKDTGLRMKKLRRKVSFRCDDIEDRSKGEHSDESSDDTLSSTEIGILCSRFQKLPCCDKVIDDDVPQSFSHWSFVYTKRDLLICDIQGVLESSSSKFRFTDPAIHSRDQRFGRSDFGKSGTYKFFKTHTCNPLCKLLKLNQA
eukprot:Awhi_evm1s9794